MRCFCVLPSGPGFARAPSTCPRGTYATTETCEQQSAWQQMIKELIHIGSKNRYEILGHTPHRERDALGVGAAAAGTACKLPPLPIGPSPSTDAIDTILRGVLTSWCYRPEGLQLCFFEAQSPAPCIERKNKRSGSPMQQRREW